MVVFRFLILGTQDLINGLRISEKDGVVRSIRAFFCIAVIEENDTILIMEINLLSFKIMVQLFRFKIRYLLFMIAIQVRWDVYTIGVVKVYDCYQIWVFTVFWTRSGLDLVRDGDVNWPIEINASLLGFLLNQMKPTGDNQNQILSSSRYHFMGLFLFFLFNRWSGICYSSWIWNSLPFTY